MARDSYSTAEAAKVLGLSERRVRQLISEGRLAAERDGEGNLRLSQATVNTERRNRRAKGKRPGRKAATSASSSAPPVDADAIADTVVAAVTKTIEGQLQITQKAESLARQELDEERAHRRAAEERAAQLQAELAAAQQRLADLERKRGFFGRRKG